MKHKIWKCLAAVLVFALALSACSLPVLAYADDPGDADAVTIRITPPGGEASENAAVEVRVTDNTGVGFESVHVKTESGQEWRDLTPYLEKQENRYYGAVEISGNCTVSVRVTMGDGTTYEKSRYVECFSAATDQPYTVEQVTGDTLPTATGGDAARVPNARTALTPDGQGTVLDNVSGDGGKEFFTITTPAENVFYLVIDKQRDSENVYFLNAVTEADLVALAEKDKGSGTGTSTGAFTIPGITNSPTANAEAVCTCKEKCAPGEVDTTCAVCVLNLQNCKGIEREHTTQPEPRSETANNNGGMLTVVVIVALAVGGAGYYLKIYRPKKELDDAEDLEDVPDEEETPINEDNLPPHRIYTKGPTPSEPPEPDYPGYEDYQKDPSGEEPEEPDYEE